MSIKKEIMNVVKDGGTYKIKNNVTLRRWFKGGDMMSEGMSVAVKVDGCTNGEVGHIVLIKSRDYDGIISEVNKAIADTYAAAAKRLVKEITNGYAG